MIQKNSVVIENPTKDVKETLLKGYKKVASASIYFDGEKFAIGCKIENGAYALVDTAKRSEAELKHVFENTLSNGAEQFCDYLENCYVDGYQNLEKKFIDFLKKEGVI